MDVRHLALGLATLAGACGAELSDATAPTADAIIGGMIDPGDNNVVMLVQGEFLDPNANLLICTAAVIAPHVVLTAAHCLLPDPADGVAYKIHAYLGTALPPRDQMDPTQFLPAGGLFPDPAFQPDHLELGHDFAAVTFRDTFPAAPLPVNTDIEAVKRTHRNDITACAQDPTLRCGAQPVRDVRVIGFGESNHQQGGLGVRRKASVTLDRIDSTNLYLGSANEGACHGDSGGPAIMQINGRPTIIGVASTVSDRKSLSRLCVRNSVYTRVDPYATFLVPFLN